VIGTAPYFDEPFSAAGFDVGGFEVGLMPTEGCPDTIPYWGVRDVAAAGASLEAQAVVGVIEKPNFAATMPEAEPSAGPGR